VTLLVIFLAGGFAYSQYQLRTVANPAYAQEQASKQTAQIVARVGRLMVLPVEMPQIATVADVEMLKKTQLFFLNAHNGDQVLVYTDRAIIYSPSLDKIINVGPITRDTTPAKPATTPTSTASTTKTK
jgi:ABC-type microcin C transport system permease subunit YejB